MPAGRRRVDDVATIELRHGQEIQHRHEHPEPAGERGRVQHDGLMVTDQETAHKQGQNRIAG